MFEIRVICDPADADRITTTLNTLFDTGAVRRYPSRSTAKDRLYVTADHQPNAQTWPTPEEAYATAPSIISEIGWTAQAATDKPRGWKLERDFWLRKAAVLDRIALQDESDGIHGDACALARQAGQRVMDMDAAVCTTCDVRPYVRQQYAQWVKSKSQ
ncbi:hypothetical protein [Streptomyces flavidovirens]|uniref:hypothetical protein n=1 Tax=Streptomyces flavidovirens TaxID=67298 RepID=UPI0003F7EFFA|nr:hypothetical protein [Streptomyces flavidovirens]